MKQFLVRKHVFTFLACNLDLKINGYLGNLLSEHSEHFAVLHGEKKKTKTTAIVGLFSLKSHKKCDSRKFFENTN